MSSLTDPISLDTVKLATVAPQSQKASEGPRSVISHHGMMHYNTRSADSAVGPHLCGGWCHLQPRMLVQQQRQARCLKRVGALDMLTLVSRWGRAGVHCSFLLVRELRGAAPGRGWVEERSGERQAGSAASQSLSPQHLRSKRRCQPRYF